MLKIEVTGMERYDEEEERAEEAYEKHKCKGCLWAKWQTPYIVSCLFPRCVRYLNLPMAKATGFLCTIELLPYLRMDTDSTSTRLSWANTLMVLCALYARFKTLDFSSL